MHRRASLAAAFLAVLALLLALWWLRRGTGGIESAHAVAQGEPARERSELASPPLSEQPVARQEVAAPPPEVRRSDPTLARVRGLCVAAESGAPLAGCTVSFGGYSRNNDESARNGPADWTDPQPILTGSDGRFDFAFAPPPSFQYSMSIDTPGRVPCTARWGSIAVGQDEDLGDIALLIGFTVEGRIVDTRGAPVADANVSLKNLPLPVGGGMGASDSRGGKSDTGGAFVIACPIPAGTWPVGVETRGLKLVSPDRVTVDAARGAEPLTVVVQRMPSISGVVVDETGAPVPRVYLAVAVRANGRMAAAWTKADGTFLIYAVTDDLQPVRLEVSDPGPCELPADAGPAYAWGTTGVRIELVRALSFELTVVERGSGAPVEGFSVVCASLRSTSSREKEARLGDPHPGGRVTVDRVWRGTSKLVVHPRDPALASSTPLTIEAAAGPLPPVRIELDRKLQRAVRVVTAAGAPVTGSKVELVLLADDELHPSSLVLQPRGGAMSWSSDPKRDGFGTTRATRITAELADVAISGADGVAHVAMAAADEPPGLRVTGLRHTPLVLQEAIFPASGEPLQVVVENGAGLSGVVRVAGYAPGTLAIVVAAERYTDNGVDSAPTKTLEADGSFDFPSVEPGTYHLWLRLGGSYRREGSSNGWWLRFRPALASVEVAKGEAKRVELDGARYSAGSVSGSIRLDGRPAPDCRVELEFDGGEIPTRFGQFVPDPEGRFSAQGLPPGTWRARLIVGDFKARQGDPIDAADTFEIAPGERVVRAFAFERLRLRLRLLQPDGQTPVADADVGVLQTNRFLHGHTDAAGWLVLDPAPRGSMTLRVGDLVSETFEMPADERESEFEVVMMKD